MAALLRKLAKAAPIAFRGDSKSNFADPRFPFGAIAAVAGCVSYYYCHSSANLVYLEQISEDSGKKVALNPDKWIEFKLQDRAPVSHNSHLFRFSFDPSSKLGLDIASCILTRAPMGENAEGKPKYAIRPYTPISDPEAKGYFDLLIKVYPEGKMSQHFAKLKPGDILQVKGPIEKLHYSSNMKKHIGMIAGGSGITPMLQVIEAILKNPDDNTQVSLVYANLSPDDILLKKKLDVLAATHPNLKVFYTVDNPTNDWRGGIGYVSKNMIVKGLPPPGDDTLILIILRIWNWKTHHSDVATLLGEKGIGMSQRQDWIGSYFRRMKDIFQPKYTIGVCGPPGMIRHLSGEKPNPREQGELTGLLKDVGFTENMVYKF